MPNARPVRQDGENFRDAVGRYLCSRGHVILNERLKRGEPPLMAESRADVAWLATELERFARQEFADDFTPPGDNSMRSALRLDDQALVDGMPGRARWVLQHWDPRKIEGRIRGGRARTPRWVPGVLSQFDDLPEKERQTAALALGMSRATYYRLRCEYDSDWLHDRPAFDDADLWALIGEEPPVGILR